MTILNLYVSVLSQYVIMFTTFSQAYDEHELLRLVYYGGVAPTIRKEVWPFLLGHYHFDMTQKCRMEVGIVILSCGKITNSGIKVGRRVKCNTITH